MLMISLLTDGLGLRYRSVKFRHTRRLGDELAAKDREIAARDEQNVIQQNLAPAHSALNDCLK